MISWSKRRKFFYGTILIAAIVFLIAIPVWKITYTPPSCFDGIQNGTETGIDCGGSCQKLCPSAFFSPVVDWSRSEQVANGLYNIATYIENPNVDVGAAGVPFKVQLYDNIGVPILEYTGTADLPPHRNALAFKGAVHVDNRKPTKVLFQFTGEPNWRKQSDKLAKLFVTDKRYEENENSSSLIVTFENRDVLPVGKIDVYVVLYDKDSNAIGFSRTVLDGIGAGGTAKAPFTWPVSHDDKVVSIEVLPVAKY